MLSGSGQQAIAEFMDNLRQVEDVKAATLRNYESDLRHFASWLETTWDEGGEPVRFSPQRVTTPTITQYCTHMQQVAKLKPATINRRLVALERYFRWAVEQGLITRSPAAPVRLLPMEPPTPRHLTDREESDLVAAVSAPGVPARDRALLITMLHTGPRAQEVATLLLPIYASPRRTAGSPFRAASGPSGVRCL
ncbi:MAG: tyrosine-type recombinase/integrase [Symbiobacteriia bacterium]